MTVTGIVGRTRRVWRSRAALLVAAGVAIVILLLAVIIGITGGDSPTSPAPPPPAPPTAGASGQVAGPTDTDTHQFVAPQMPWTWVGGGLGVPDGGKKYGPVVVNGQLAAGYARTPIGSLVADLNISGRATAGEDWRPSAEQQLVGPGQDAWIQKRGAVDSVPPTTGFCQVVGYRFAIWTLDDAQMEIASYCPGAGLQGVMQEVQWVNGDWRVVTQPDGSMGTNPHALSSLTGFTPWGTQ